MAEQVENGSNGIRKWFPGIRIVEAVIIAAILALANNYITIPKLELKMELQNKNLCDSVGEIKGSIGQIKSSVDTMGREIVALQIKDKENDGELNLIRYHLGLRDKKR